MKVQGGIDSGCASIFLRSPGARCESNRVRIRPDKFKAPRARLRSDSRGFKTVREGFEPSVPLPVRFFSKEVLSTTQPPNLFLRCFRRSDESGAGVKSASDGGRRQLLCATDPGKVSGLGDGFGQADFHAAIRFANLVGADSLRRRAAEDGSGAEIKLRVVPGTGDAAVLDGTEGDGGVGVGTEVVETVDNPFVPD